MAGMKLTHRIADWITGDALSDAKSSASAWEITSELAWESIRERQARLDRIAAMETPGANATVKRMARVARGEE